MKYLLLLLAVSFNVSAEVYNSGTVIKYTNGNYMVIPNLSTPRPAVVYNSGTTVKYSNGNLMVIPSIVVPKSPSPTIRGKYGK